MFGVIPVLFLLLTQLPAPTATDAPVAPSVYWRLSDRGWTAMSPAQFQSANTKGMDNYILTDGYTNFDMAVTFTEAKARLRLPAEPIFKIQSAQAADGMAPILVRLESKKDRRVCHARISDTVVDNRYGFRKSDIVRLVASADTDSPLIVRPEKPLSPGEYLLVVNTPDTGYDFGVD